MNVKRLRELKSQNKGGRPKKGEEKRKGWWSDEDENRYQEMRAKVVEGFTQIPNHIILANDLNSAEIAVLSAQLMFSFGKESTFPGVKTLARATGMHPDTISRITKSLEKKGYITKQRRGRGIGGSGKTLIYTFTEKARIRSDTGKIQDQKVLIPIKKRLNNIKNKTNNKREEREEYILPPSLKKISQEREKIENLRCKVNVFLLARYANEELDKTFEFDRAGFRKAFGEAKCDGVNDFFGYIKDIIEKQFKEYKDWNRGGAGVDEETFNPVGKVVREVCDHKYYLEDWLSLEAEEESQKEKSNGTG